MTIEAFRAQIDTNLIGVVNVTKAALPILRAQSSGHIVQVSSLGGRIANAGLSAYQAAKFAVGGFSEALSQEVAPLGIRVTVLEPGGMRTDWSGSSMTIPTVSEPYAPTVGALAALMQGGGVGAAGDPAKVAGVVLRVAEMSDPPLAPAARNRRGHLRGACRAGPRGRRRGLARAQPLYRRRAGHCRVPRPARPRRPMNTPIEASEQEIVLGPTEAANHSTLRRLRV